MPGRRKRRGQVGVARRHHLGAVGQVAGQTGRRTDPPGRGRDGGRVHVRSGETDLSRVAPAQGRQAWQYLAGLSGVGTPLNLPHRGGGPPLCFPCEGGGRALALHRRERRAGHAGEDRACPAARLRDLRQLRLPAPGSRRRIHGQDRRRTEARSRRHPGSRPLDGLRGAGQRTVAGHQDRGAGDRTAFG